MIIGIDIGNTTVEFGIIKDINNIKSYRFFSNKDSTEDEWFFIVYNILQIEKNPHIKTVLISSVVPQLTDKIKNAISKLLKTEIFVIGENLSYPLKIKYENPQEVGADRIVNAIAVVNMNKYPSIVVDFGTAVTFDFINKNAEYEGGAIFPGIRSSIQTLFSKTAKLPQVNLKKISNPVGKNTVESIQTGIYNGYISMVEGMVGRYSKVCGCDLHIILTGGDAEIISDGLSIDHTVEPFLNMKGIFFIYKNLEKILHTS